MTESRPKRARTLRPLAVDRPTPRLVSVKPEVIGDGMRVLIRRRSRNHDGWDEEEVLWPQGWSLPEQGTIVLGRTVQGWCEHVEFDIVNAKVVVVLRP